MFNNCPVKIIEVHNTLSELTIFDNDTLFDTDITEVEPIPLTKDILKNNGWKRQWNYIYTNKEFPYIELYYSDNKYKLTEMGVNIGNKFISMISSVHELSTFYGH